MGDRLANRIKTASIEVRAKIGPSGISGTTNPGLVGGTLLLKSSEPSDFPIMYTNISGLVEFSVMVILTGSVVRENPSGSIGLKAQ